MNRIARLLVVVAIGIAVFVAYYLSARGMRSYERAEHLRRTGRYVEAIAAYERAVEGNPRRGDFHFGLSEARQAAGEYGLALEACECACRCDPADPVFRSRYQLLKGIVLADGERWGEAIRALDRSRDGCRDSILCCVKDRIVADALRRRTAGENEAAERLLMTALAVSGDDCRLLFELALTCREMEQGSRAIRYLEKAVRIAPEQARYQYELGREYRRAGRYPEAIAAFSRAGSYGDASRRAGEARAIERGRRQAEADSLCAEAVAYLLGDTTRYSQWRTAKTCIDRAIELRPAERRFRLVRYDLLLDELSYFRGAPGLEIRIDDLSVAAGKTVVEITVKNSGPEPIEIGPANFCLVGPNGGTWPARSGRFPVRRVPPGCTCDGILGFDCDLRPATLVCTGTPAGRVTRLLPATAP
ncbi:MAG TPA: tetratricopeptide repeat protein [Alphaproteobacteria bacterium]|nr:tetratricopeptide repeat protein [Alphaproteobacteria bacterium]